MSEQSTQPIETSEATETVTPAEATTKNNQPKRRHMYEGITMSERTINIIIGIIVVALCVVLYLALKKP